MPTTSKKKNVYQQKKIRVFYFTNQPSFSGEKTRKFKYYIACTFIPTTSLKRGYYDKSKINPRKSLFISNQFISDSHVD